MTACAPSPSPSDASVHRPSLSQVLASARATLSREILRAISRTEAKTRGSMKAGKIGAGCSDLRKSAPVAACLRSESFAGQFRKYRRSRVLFSPNAYEQGWSAMRSSTAQRRAATRSACFAIRTWLRVVDARHRPFQRRAVYSQHAALGCRRRWSAHHGHRRCCHTRLTASSRFKSGLILTGAKAAHERSRRQRVPPWCSSSLSRFDPIYGLTPRRLQEYLQQWNLGFIRWQSLLWSQMRERDDQIKSVEAKRVFSPSRAEMGDHHVQQPRPDATRSTRLALGALQRKYMLGCSRPEPSRAGCSFSFGR